MADTGLVQALLQGADTWAKARQTWEVEHPEVPLDLTGAYLRRANLSKADLWEADLRWANLWKANLSGADLSWADLSWANLSGADLRQADLSWADLRQADLSWANLSKADLRGADLRWARGNEGTIFTGAKMGRALLAGFSGWEVAQMGRTNRKRFQEANSE